LSPLASPTDQMIVEAAQWLTQLNDESCGDAERKAFDAWHARDPRHAVAMQRMQAVWGSLDDVPAAPARIALKRAFTRPKSRIAARSAQTLALIGLLMCAWAGVDRLPVWMADQRTGTGERKEILLADGSQVQLDSQSALDIRFDGHQRLVELLQGEMWVQVAKDANRPFVVKTDQGTATALGTQYLVKRNDNGATTVTVIESVVAVKGKGADVVKVRAGQKTQLRDGQVQPSQPIGNDDPAAWTRGVLKVNDRPLSEVLDALARYRRGLVRFDEGQLQGLRVSGVFRLDDTDAALATLADNLPIRVEHFTDLVVVIKKR
jgi:transmembrane sensor